MAVSKRLRFEIFRRDNYTCRYCGHGPPDVKLRVDHVVPVALGGTDEPTNLVTSCEPCNAGKSSTSPDAELVEDVEQDALRWSKAMERAAELHRRQAEDVADAVEDFGYAWVNVWAPGQYIACHEPDRGWHYEKDPDTIYPWVVRLFLDPFEDGEPGRLFETRKEAEEYAERQQMVKVPPRPKDWRKSAKAWIAGGLTPKDFRLLVEEVKEDRDYVQWDRKWSYTAGCCWNLLRQRQSTAQALLAAEAEGDA